MHHVSWRRERCQTKACIHEKSWSDQFTRGMHYIQSAAFPPVLLNYTAVALIKW